MIKNASLVHIKHSTEVSHSTHPLNIDTHVEHVNAKFNPNPKSQFVHALTTRHSVQ